MQDTSSDEKEFTGLIIGGADAALLLQVSRGGISLAASHWPAMMVSKLFFVQGMSPRIDQNHVCVACSCMQRNLSAPPLHFSGPCPQLLPFACLESFGMECKHEICTFLPVHGR
jgi:hypothetical protein